MPTMKLRSSTGATAGVAFLATTLRGLLIFLAGFLLALVARKLSSSTEELTITAGDFFAPPTIVLAIFVLETFGANGSALLMAAGLMTFTLVVGAGFLALLTTGWGSFVRLTLLTMTLSLK
jgi:hypothetical protein